MVFSSAVFIFIFLPIFLFFYLLIPNRLKNLTLVIFSLFFYFWGENFLVWIILTSTICDFILGKIISDRYENREVSESGELRPDKIQLACLIGSLSVNLGLLAYFKYTNFFINNTIGILSTFGIESQQMSSLTEIALPLGISFYTFQTLSYTIDIYRGKLKATNNLVDFACFVTMFPQLVAGPIVRYADVEKKLKKREVTFSEIELGIKQFILGFAKKMLIANQVAPIVHNIYKLPNDEFTAPIVWIGVLAYTIQIYFDFSGYSDMAIGLGRILGFKFPQNFDHPYISLNIREFWRRWHMTLSNWFRDYLYIPLGGNRNGKRSTYRNLLIVFILCGIWHGAEWTFLIWGLWHGVFLVLERTRFGMLLEKCPPMIRRVYVLFVVMFSWMIFRSENLHQAMGMGRAMMGFGEGKVNPYPIETFLTPTSVTALLCGIFLSINWFDLNIPHYIKPSFESKTSNLKIGNQLFGYLTYTFLFYLCIIVLASNTMNPFIYFRF